MWCAPVGSSTQGYVRIIKLVNCYVAMHMGERKNTFISPRPSTDLKVAQETAKTFAEIHNIPCDIDVHTLDRPIYTVLKQEGKWFPAKLNSSNIEILTGIGKEIFDISLNQAIDLTRIIAMERGCDFLPNLGISLSRE